MSYKDEAISRETEVINGKMYISGDKKVALKLLFHDDICHSTRKDFRSVFYDDFLGKGKVVFDLGAYIGDSTSYFLETGSEVYAFEPNPVAYKCLLHNCPNATLFNRAVSSKEHKQLGFGYCDGGEKNPAGQTFEVENGGVKVICLDEFVNINRCDLLKIDVQGFEPYVIDGGKEFLLKFKPLIYTEIWGKGLIENGFDEDVIERKLTELGYRKRFKMRRDAVFIAER